jgi:hypothetical protein
MKITRLIRAVLSGGGIWLASAFCFELLAQSQFTLLKDASNPALSFTNTSARYKGVAWIDLDDDNRPDLFVAQRFLFHNAGQGLFKALPDVYTNHGEQGAAGAAWGDLDNDGDPDLVLAARHSALLRNDGGTFVNINASLPDWGESFAAWDCSFVDADNNGRLDPLFVHARGFHGPAFFPCKFFLQHQNGQFSALKGWSFVDSLAPFTIPTWCDYDLDGDQDLFIGSGPGGRPGFDHCFKNLLKEKGSLDFQRLKTYPFDQPQDGQVYSFPDFDNDGDLDLCLSNYSGARSGLWRNENGQFVPHVSPFSNRRSYLSNNWADLDNDGDLDVLFTRDSANYVHCYWNDGQGNFSESQTPSTSVYGLAGVSLADYDNDGDLDAYTNGSGEARALFRNELAGNLQRHWFQLKLQGLRSNRSALGARVQIKAKLNGQRSVWQTRTLSAHTSFQGHNDLRLHFGLNTATQVDSIRVYWPSGQVDVWTNLAVDQFLKLEEAGPLSLLPEQTQDLEAKPLGKKNRLQLNIPTEIQTQRVLLANEQGQAMLCHFVQKGSTLQLNFEQKINPGQYYLNIWTAHGLKLRGKFRWPK